MISRVPNDGEDERNPLDPTGERMIFDNLWAHFWAKNGSSKNQTGLSGILTFLLQKASPSNLEFNRLVQWIDWDTKNLTSRKLIKWTNAATNVYILTWLTL